MAKHIINSKNLLKKKFTKFMQKKLVLLFVAIILAFTVLVGRITYINASNGSDYTRMVLYRQQYDSRTIPFKRGDILDRNGTKMAASERVYNVILDVEYMCSDKDYIEPTIKVLGECFGIEEGTVRTLIEEKPSSRYSILKKGVDFETAQRFEAVDADEENYPDVRGIWLEDDYIRKYPYNTLASDVIGFTANGNIGTCGIEASYNSVLNGTDGREYGYLDEDADFERTVKEPQSGDTVVSTIDLQVQSIVEKHILAFNETYKNGVRPGEGSKNTAVIVMNPQNGEILAEASYPNFDLNQPRDLTKYYSEEQIAAMSEEEKVEKYNELWNNFCVSEPFEPGSTAKPFTISAGLETGLLTGQESYRCGGMLHVGDYDISCNNVYGHGAQTLKETLENSCNVALMEIGFAMGKEEFCRYQELFGFGQNTGIDLPRESAGVLYDVDDMDSTSLATNAFGQNFNVTMTQLAASFCSLINGGEYYKPHVVRQIWDENGNLIENKNPVLTRRTVSKETSDIIKDYMFGVVEEGTGKSAKVEGYDIGGKTGTAEKHPRSAKNHLLSFIGYAPQEKPQVVVYVVVDEPNVAEQASCSYAMQLSADIMREIFPYLGIEKSAGSAQ